MRYKLRALLAHDPLLVATFAALWVASLVPLWRPVFLPLLDLPNHLAAIALWHRFGDPSWGYSRFYDLNLLPLPYWGYLFPVHLLSYVAPVMVANKIYLSLYALALPAGAAALARQMNRSARLSLFAFPLVFNLNLSFGFVSYCAGLAVLLWALWALDRFLDGPTRARGVALALLSLALYFTHVLPWIYFGLASAILVGCHGWRPRRMLAAAALELPSLLLALYGFWSALHHDTAVHAGPLHYEATSEPLLASLSSAPVSLLTAWSGNGAYHVLMLLGALWLLLVGTARTDEHEAEARQRGWPYRLELLALLAVLLAIFAPGYLKQPVDLWMVGQRYFALAALLLALVPHGAIVGRRALLLIPVAALAFYYPLGLARHWKEFDRRAAAARRLLQRVPRGSSTLCLLYGEGDDPSVEKRAFPYLQFHAYAQLYAGGYDPWALSTGFPMVAKKDRKLPAPPFKHPELFDAQSHTAGWDYLLSRGEIGDYSIFGPNDAGAFPLVARDQDWRLYRVKR